MRVEFKAPALVVITPENSLENYALKHWEREHRRGGGDAGLMVELFAETRPNGLDQFTEEFARGKP